MDFFCKKVLTVLRKNPKNNKIPKKLDMFTNPIAIIHVNFNLIFTQLTLHKFSSTEYTN